jgi:glycerophosphoryl diester phosphodiesterase
MLIFAHRGCHRDAPENTLEAFRIAREVGADGIETDVRADKNGTPILFHDRRAKNGALVSDLDVADLRRICGYHVPTLEEALKEVPDIIWNLEIKTPGAVDWSDPVMKRFADRAKIIVSSFIHQEVVDCVRKTGLEGGLLIAHRPRDPLAIFAGMPPEVSTLIWNFETADAGALKSVSEAGRHNMIYGLCDKSELAEIAGGGVGAIITDFPERFIAARR